jgi:cytochrome c2
MRAETIAAAALLFGATGAAAPGAVLDGKAIFTAQKCEVCHAVSSADIKATGKIKAPDLSAVAVQDATLLGKYLRKQGQIKGKNHVKPFTGTDEELGALIAWLQKQGKPADAK